MKRFVFPFAVLATFAIGFLGVWIALKGQMDTPLVSLVVDRVDCDRSLADCRARLRAEAETRLRLGDDRSGLAVYRRLAAAGDAKAAFQIGWYHEEAYRRAVGRPLEAGSPIVEETQFAVARLPGGSAFEALVDRHAAPQTEADRRQASRALAFLWYAQAAQRGFGPAMNNLASMYQFGITGKVDRAEARRWYIAAYDAGTPAAALNLEVLKNAGYDDPKLECLEVGGSWLPLMIVPPVEYLHVDVIEHTRFRGLRSDRHIVGMIGMLVQGMPIATPVAREARGAALEVLKSSVRLVAGPGTDGWPLYDDETPESRKTIPTFAEGRQEALKRQTARGDCRGVRTDPRKQRAAEAGFGLPTRDENDVAKEWLGR